MLFSSTTFIFMFLPIVCAIYFLLGRNLTLKNTILLVASIIFYAWGDLNYLAIMLLTIFINYWGALFISKTTSLFRRKVFLFLTIVLNLCFLIYFKYFNFIIDNINFVFNQEFNFLDVVMPIGISFYTFQALSYVVDVYRQEVNVQTDIFKLALFICLFPQLVAGPIVKYHDIDSQIDYREESYNKVIYGIKRFIIGLAKKVLIANTLGAVADKIFALPVNEFGSGIAWLGAIAYAMQLYYDFSGYSDMAIGLGYIFGFKFLENFNYPYISKSITEFWRRWHISLSTWFKTYVYIPIGGNRISLSRTCINLFIVFLITGLWHGASWTFVCWGVWNGVFIIFEKLTKLYKESQLLVVNIFKHLYTILIFTVGWVLFRSDTIAYAFDYVKNMFALTNSTDKYNLIYYVDNIEIITFVVAIICAMPIFRKILIVKLNGKQEIAYRFILNAWLIFLFVNSIAEIAVSTYNPFIYFRF